MANYKNLRMMGVFVIVGPSLLSFFGVGESIFKRGGSDSKPLKANLVSCSIHHLKHIQKPEPLPSQNPSFGRSLFSKDKSTGWRAVNPHFPFYSSASYIVIFTQCPIWIYSNLWNAEKGEPLCSNGCFRSPCKNCVDNIFSQFVFSPCYKNFLPFDVITSIGLLYCLSLYIAKIRTRLRFCKAHCPRPEPGVHFLTYKFLQLFASK